MSGNPTLSPFSGWNELHGGSMERNSSSEISLSGEANRRSWVLQEALGNRGREAHMLRALEISYSVYLESEKGGLSLDNTVYFNINAEE